MSKTIRSNENIFRAFGISSASARNLQIRSLLMIEVEKFIRHRGMTQVEAADYFGVSQPYVSDLLNGRIDRVSIDKLVTLLDLAGRSVIVKIGKKPVRRQAVTRTHT